MAVSGAVARVVAPGGWLHGCPKRAAEGRMATITGVRWLWLGGLFGG